MGTWGYHAINDYMSWPGQLQHLLGPGSGPSLTYNIWNFGHSGALASRIPKDSIAYELLAKNGKKPYWDTEEFNASQTCGNWNVAPDIVIIMLGTNDANIITWPDKNYGEGMYASSLKDLVNVYTELGAKVYIGIPPPAFIDGAYSLIQSVINHKLPKIIQEVAAECGESKASVVSIHDVFERHCPDITNDTVDCDWISGAGEGTPPTPPFNDGVHPNSNGYYAIASRMFQVLPVL